MKNLSMSLLLGLLLAMFVAAPVIAQEFDLGGNSSTVEIAARLKLGQKKFNRSDWAPVHDHSDLLAVEIEWSLPTTEPHKDGLSDLGLSLVAGIELSSASGDAAPFSVDMYATELSVGCRRTWGRVLEDRDPARPRCFMTYVGVGIVVLDIDLEIIGPGGLDSPSDGGVGAYWEAGIFWQWPATSEETRTEASNLTIFGVGIKHSYVDVDVGNANSSNVFLVLGVKF